MSKIDQSSEKSECGSEEDEDEVSEGETKINEEESTNEVIENNSSSDIGDTENPSEPEKRPATHETKVVDNAADIEDVQ